MSSSKRLKRFINKDIPSANFITNELLEIDLALEYALKINSNNMFDPNILPIFALYDDRKKFCVIRAKVRGLKARIGSGKEAPIMRRILRKTVRSKEKFLEDIQEIRTMTPPSSAPEAKVSYFFISREKILLA